MQRAVECHERETTESNIQEDCVESKDVIMEENERHGSFEVKAGLSCGTDVASSVESVWSVNSVDDDDAEKDCDLVEAIESAPICDERSKLRR